MRRSATVTSKGQITIPVEVRKSLGLHEGDQVLFEILEDGADPVARVRRAPDFIAMAGSIPPRKRVPRSWAAEREIAVDEAVRDEG
jgi:AbrB family looped-hinge helix DNA binding protein